jgi:hypothetical protein
MDKDQHRARRRCGTRDEYVEQVAVGRAVFDIPLDPDARIGLLLMQWGIDRGGMRQVDDAAELHQLPGDILGHRASLGPRRARE